MSQANDDTLHFAGFQLSPSLRKLSAVAGEIELRAKSFDVLLYLAASPGRVISKTELLDAIWPDVTVSDESLERCISDIRAAISDDDRKIVKTVARRGYILAADVKSSPTFENVPQRKAWLPYVALSVAVLLGILFSYRMLTPLAERPQLLAVLPLQNASGQASQVYFADGLTEDIASTLTRLKSVGVVALGSSSKFKDSKESMVAIGERLGAAFLLTGSIKQASSNITLSLQLIDAATGAQIWTGKYDGVPGEFIDAKSRLVATIAKTLDSQITKAELDRISGKPIENLTAYDLVLKGNAALANIHLEKRGEAIAAARSFYQSAATADPRSSPAAEGLANSYLMAWLEPSPGHALNQEFRSPNILKWAGDYARQAIELDGTSASARATLGWVLYWQHGPAEALALFDRANEIDPGRADWRYGLMLSHGGRAIEAEAYMKRLMQIDPLFPPRYNYLLGKAYYFQGRYKEALPLIRQAAAEMPTHRPSHVLLAAVASDLGMKDELPKYKEDIFKLIPDFTIESWLKFIKFSDAGYEDRMRQALLSTGLPP
jgi:TolB-like protein/DNA-binding winged helix-turn-helix (wHTH) protein